MSAVHLVTALKKTQCGTGASGFVYITMIGLSGVLLVATLYYISGEAIDCMHTVTTYQRR